MFASIRNPDAPSHPAARPRTTIRLLFGEALESLSEISKTSHELDRLDEHDERLAGRRDEILRQIERRRSGWAKLVRRASEEIVEGEFHELPSGAPDIEAGPNASGGTAAG